MVISTSDGLGDAGQAPGVVPASGDTPLGTYYEYERIEISTSAVNRDSRRFRRGGATHTANACLALHCLPPPVECSTGCRAGVERGNRGHCDPSVNLQNSWDHAPLSTEDTGQEQVEVVGCDEAIENVAHSVLSVVRKVPN